MRGQSRRHIALLVPLLTVFAIAGCAKAPQRPAEPSLATVDGDTVPVAEFEACVKRVMDQAVVAGLDCVILNDGHIVYHETFGFRDMESGEPLDETSVFNAASLSKTVFAYLVTLLVEDGLIDLDRPLYEYLEKPIPEHHEYSDLAGDDRWREITARMVLSHTSGFPNWRFLTEEKRLSFLSDPGTRFSYSGEGIKLLQMVVEHRTGKDLETLAQERVFVPLGMADTSYLYQPSFEGRYALPHNEFGWAGNSQRRSSPGAAGSMTTNAVDYGRFLEAIMTRERAQQSRGPKMTDTVIAISSERMFGPGAWRDGDSGDRVDISWGLGWGLFDSPRGRAFFHTGHDTGEQNYTVSFLGQGIGVALLSNSDNFESVAAEIVHAAIGDVYSPFEWLGYEPFDPAATKTPPPRPQRIEVAAEVIEPFTGKYQVADSETFFVRAEGNRLLYSGEGMYWDEIFAESPTRFRFRGQDIVLNFVPQADGSVNRIDIEYQGLGLSAERVQ